MGTTSRTAPRAPVEGEDDRPGTAPPAVPVQLVGAWFDPYDPVTWSGILANLIAGLEARGRFAGYRDVSPYPALTRRCFRWLDATGRRDRNWLTTPEMRALTGVANVARRRRPVPDVVSIVPASGYGRPVGGRVVTLSEIAPADLVRLGPEDATSFGFPGVGRRGLAAVARQQARLHRRAQACCVASSWAARRLVSEHGVAPSAVHVIGYGRNVSVAPPDGRDWSAPRFLFVGNDWRRKRGDEVVRAFARLRQEVPGAVLDVVGLHPPLDVPGVTGHGRLGFEDADGRARLSQLFRQATCFVMPSSLEPFGIVYVEAAAAGVPSIGTTAGGTATSIGDGGLRVAPGDGAALLDAMRQLARPDTAARLGERALRRSVHFTWPLVVGRLLSAIDRIDGVDGIDRDRGSTATDPFPGDEPWYGGADAAVTRSPASPPAVDVSTGPWQHRPQDPPHHQPSPRPQEVTQR